MKEIAFIVKKDSKMYKSYMTQKMERDKFHKLAQEFFKKRNFSNKGKKYYLTKRLMVELNEEDIKKYKAQLIAGQRDNISRFKLSSKIQKEWESEVVNKCDMDKLECNKFWYYAFGAFMRGVMWEYKGQLYGYLQSNCDDIKPSDDMEILDRYEYYYPFRTLPND